MAREAEKARLGSPGPSAVLLADRRDGAGPLGRLGGGAAARRIVPVGRSGNSVRHRPRRRPRHGQELCAAPACRGGGAAGAQRPAGPDREDYRRRNAGRRAAIPRARSRRRCTARSSAITPPWPRRRRTPPSIRATPPPPPPSATTRSSAGSNRNDAPATSWRRGARGSPNCCSAIRRAPASTPSSAPAAARSMRSCAVSASTATAPPTTAASSATLGRSRQSRLGLFLRAIFGFRGQTRLIVWALLAFALAFVADYLRDPSRRRRHCRAEFGARPRDRRGEGA